MLCNSDANPCMQLRQRGSVPSIPANKIHGPNDVLMLAHRLRRWPNIKTTLSQRVVFTVILNIIHLINWLRRFYRITMSLKRPFVPKSDVKQWSTTTTSLLLLLGWDIEWIIVYVAFCTIIAILRQKPDGKADIGTMLISYCMSSRFFLSAQHHRQHCTLKASKKFFGLATCRFGMAWLQYWFHKMGQIFHQWLACVNASQPVISPGASPARQAQNWLRPAHEMGSSPHTVRARKIYPPKFYLGLHQVYCVAANMDAVNHVSSRRAGLARSGQDRARSAWPHSASSEQLRVDLNVQ